MANIIENTANPAWSTGIYQIETSDPVLGGANGIANRQAKELAARTQWLKTEIARTIALIGTNQTAADQKYALKTTQINAGAGLTGGGLLRDNSTISMGTPSKITATSQNSAVSNTHTHEIDKASTSIAGIVRLSSATDSTAENLAATPKAIKQLADLIGATGSASFPQRGALGSRNLNDLHGMANYGIWYQAANAGATVPLNYPVQIAGTLFVLPSAYSGVQLYIPFGGREIHIRHNSNGNWSAWRIIGEVINNLTTDSATAALSARQGKLLKEQADKFRVETVSSGNEDANTYKTDGIYAFLRGGRNLPPNVPACHSVVIGGADGNWCRQIVYKAYSVEIWVRQQTEYATDAWSGWLRIDNGADWTSIRDKPNTFAGYGLTGNQTYNGQLTFAAGNYPAVKINSGATMTYGGWSNRLQFDGAYAAITLAGRYAIGLHSNGNLYLFDNEQRAYGLTYNYAAKSLNVGGEITSGSHHLTRKADRATTLAGYGITDGVTPAQLQAAVAGIVSSSPAALDTLRELAAALGNDPNYAATTARKLGEAAPSGTVAWFAGNTAPAGWLKANGAAVSRTAYAALFAAIGTTYGTGDGRTTFNLPDLRGEFVRGWDDARLVDNGRALGSRQGDAIRNITGTVIGGDYDVVGAGGASNSALYYGSERNITNASEENSRGAGHRNLIFDASRVVPTAAENRPRNIALLGIIKI